MEEQSNVIADSDGAHNKGERKAQVEHTFWDRIPKYRWWVTPLNLLFVSVFLFIIDYVTKPNTSWIRIDWAWWAIGGLWFTYALSFILFKRPEIAWIIGPLLMFGAGILLLSIDYAFPPNSGPLALDWALIPITALLTFGVFIPVATKFGRKKEKPIDKFRKALADMEKQHETKEVEN
jgi:hypothetical protein